MQEIMDSLNDPELRRKLAAEAQVNKAVDNAANAVLRQKLRPHKAKPPVTEFRRKPVSIAVHHAIHTQIYRHQAR